MAELVPIVESGDLKNIVFQNDLQFLFASDPSYEGMTLEIGPNGWVVLNRASNANKTWRDTSAVSVPLTIATESAAICSVTIDENILINAGTYLLTYLYTCSGGPATVTTRLYINGGLQATQVSEIGANITDRTMTFSGTAGLELSLGDVLTFTVESSIAASVVGPNYTSILQVTHVRPVVAAGYGGIDKVTDTNYGTIGDGAWTTIDNWDQGSVTAPIGVVQDFTNSGLHFDEIGVYAISFLIALTFTEVNQGRRIQVRVLNQTEGTATGGLIYAVARNSDGVNISIPSLLVEIPSGEINDLFQLQIAGSGDSFAQATVIAASFTANRISGAL